MLQVLTSVNDFERITEIAKNSFIPITLIGYLDTSFEGFNEGDLLLHIGLNDTIHCCGKQLLSRVKLYLLSKGLNTKQCDNSLLMFNEVIVKYQEKIEKTYWSGLLLIRLVDGLNNFGIASYEMYNLALELADYYLKLNSKKGDN